MNSRLNDGGRIEQRRQPGVIGVGVLADDTRQANRIGKLRGEDDSRSPRRLQLTPVFQVGEKPDLALPGRGQRGDLMNARLPITKHIAAQAGGDFSQRESHTRRSGITCLRQVP
jgi:hypothetical protein